MDSLEYKTEIEGVIRKDLNEIFKEATEEQLSIIDLFVYFYYNPTDALTQMNEYLDEIEELTPECTEVLIRCNFFKNLSDSISIISEEQELLLLNIMSAFSQLDSNVITTLIQYKDIVEFVINRLFSTNEEYKNTALEILDDFARDENERVRTILLMHDLDQHLMLIIEKHLKSGIFTQFFIDCCTLLSILTCKSSINAAKTRYIPFIEKVINVNIPEVRECIARILCNCSYFTDLNFSREFLSEIMHFSSEHFDEQTFICLILKFLAKRSQKNDELISMLQNDIFNYFVCCLDQCKQNDSIFMCIASIFESIAKNIEDGSEILMNHTDFFNIIQQIFENGMFDAKIIAVNALCEFLLNINPESRICLFEEYNELLKECVFVFNSPNQTRSLCLFIDVLTSVAENDEKTGNSLCADFIIQTDLKDVIEELSEDSNDSNLVQKVENLMGLVSFPEE